MRASLPPDKAYPYLIASLLLCLALASCARKEPDLPEPSTTLATALVPTNPPANTQAPATATSSPAIRPTPSQETPEFTPSSPSPQPLITYTPWELVHDLTWSVDGTTLVASAGDWVYIYDAVTLEEKRSLYTGAWAVDMVYLPGDMLILAAKDGTLQFWEAANGKLICRVQAHEKGANSIDVDLDKKLLASAGNDAILRLWDLRTLLDVSSLQSIEEGCNLELQAEMIGGAVAVPVVRFSPDGTLIASIDLQVVRLRDPLTQRLVSSLRAENSLFDIAFSPDGRLLATAELGNQVRIWEVGTGETLHTLTQIEGTSQFTWCATFNPDGAILAVGSSDGTIKLWEVTSGELLRSISAHNRATSSLAFSPDGKWLASGSLDASIRLWEVIPSENTPAAEGASSP